MQRGNHDFLVREKKKPKKKKNYKKTNEHRKGGEITCEFAFFFFSPFLVFQ